MLAFTRAQADVIVLVTLPTGSDTVNRTSIGQPLGEAMETSASFEARSAPLSYPTIRQVSGEAVPHTSVFTLTGRHLAGAGFGFDANEAGVSCGLFDLYRRGSNG
jgi:hypothetical protein